MDKKNMELLATMAAIIFASPHGYSVDQAVEKAAKIAHACGYRAGSIECKSHDTHD